MARGSIVETMQTRALQVVAKKALNGTRKLFTKFVL